VLFYATVRETKYMLGPDYDHIPKKNKVAGAKAVSKAIAGGLARKILVAQDAEMKIITDVLDLAKENDVEIVWVSTMKELGEYCSISVGASCCAILEGNN
jgi:large subunit ribosomal protein L7A